MSAKFSKKTKQRQVIDFMFCIKAGTISLSLAEGAIEPTSTDLLTSAAHGLVTGDRILFTEDPSPSAHSIDAAQVANATEIFTKTAHGFVTGTKILFTEDNTRPAGLTDDTNYYVIKVDADDFKLATSYANAIAGTNLLITTDGTGANSYDAVPAVGGLVTATQYWVIKSDADSFQLASSHANALAGTDIDLVDKGAGANTYALVEEQAGMDKLQLSGNVQATATGIYKFNLPAGTFFDAAAYELVAISHQRDTVLSEDRSARTATSFTIKVDSLDETAALVDGFFSVLISGSSIEDRYSN